MHEYFFFRDGICARVCVCSIECMYLSYLTVDCYSFIDVAVFELLCIAFIFHSLNIVYCSYRFVCSSLVCVGSSFCAIRYCMCCCCCCCCFLTLFFFLFSSFGCHYFFSSFLFDRCVLCIFFSYFFHFLFNIFVYESHTENQTQHSININIKKKKIQQRQKTSTLKHKKYNLIW